MTREERSRTVIVAISGGSCSGKTSLARAVAGAAPCPGGIVIALDSYYRDLAHLPQAKRAASNFDHPDALELDLFERDIGLIASGGEALIPAYDYVTHTRRPREEWQKIPPAPGGDERLVVVEGLHALLSARARALYDLKVFIEIDGEISIRRRLERDVRERGRESREVLRRLREHVLPMFLEFVLPCTGYADLVIDGSRPVDESAAEVAAALRVR